MGCGGSDIKLSLDCESKNKTDSFDEPLRTQYIWYKSSDSLQGSDGSVTPYRSHDDFEITFLRNTPTELRNPTNPYRKVKFNKTTKELYIELKNGFVIRGVDTTDEYLKCRVIE